MGAVGAVLGRVRGLLVGLGTRLVLGALVGLECRVGLSTVDLEGSEALEGLDTGGPAGLII